MQDPARQPVRVLGAFDAMSVVIGAIIGVGIFFQPSAVAKLAGSADLAMLAWCIAGVIALCGALTFAELGGRFFGPGAQYEILRDSYGPLPAFLFVFCNATAVQAGAIGIIAVVCLNNLAVALGKAPPEGFWQLGLAALLVTLVTIANIVGVKWGSRIQNLTVVLKVLTLVVISVLAMLAPHQTHAVVQAPGSTGTLVSGVMAALVPILFTMGGWQHALWISGEVKNPRRTLPFAILGGVLVVLVVYLTANWAYFHLLGFEGVARTKTVAADAVGSLYPKFGGRAIAAMVAISAFGVLNAQLLSGPRLVQSMATDGRFFAYFGRLHARFGTPVGAILMLSVMALILLTAAGFDGVDKLTTGAVFIDGVFFVLTGAALIVVRRRERRAGVRSHDSFRTPLYPVIPLIFIVGELGVVIGAYLNPEALGAAVFGLAWIAGAAVLYVVRFRNAAR